MYILLKKLSIGLVCCVILIILVASGADETGVHMPESISNTVQSITDGYVVITGLFSAWLLTIGVMCRTLSSIPGVRTRQAPSTIHKN